MDIVVRAIFLYIFVVFVMRVIGRRELSSMTPFDLILLIVLGDALQQGLTQDDYSVTRDDCNTPGLHLIPFLPLTSRAQIARGPAARRRRERKTGRSQPQTRANDPGRGRGGDAAAADRLARRGRVGNPRVKRLHQLHQEEIAAIDQPHGSRIVCGMIPSGTGGSR